MPVRLAEWVFTTMWQQAPARTPTLKNRAVQRGPQNPSREIPAARISTTLIPASLTLPWVNWYESHLQTSARWSWQSRCTTRVVLPGRMDSRPRSSSRTRSFRSSPSGGSMEKLRHMPNATKLWASVKTGQRWRRSCSGCSGFSGASLLLGNTVEALEMRSRCSSFLRRSSEKLLRLKLSCTRLTAGAKESNCKAPKKWTKTRRNQWCWCKSSSDLVSWHPLTASLSFFRSYSSSQEGKIPRTTKTA
mmetsp:Transcript_76431/g.224264  ORF Transcript_76431/g.224264 Transcript_76431/m.224264 type:complete len:247 (+) Transcript_76431:640-1380(+)